jgi:hypothetical protein
MNQQEFFDREELRVLMASVARAGDDFDKDAMTRADAPDGVLEMAIFRAEGGEQIVAALAGNRAKRAERKVVRHNLTTSYVTFDDADHASGVTYFLVYYGHGADHMGHYRDKFRKVDGAWRIAHRYVNFDWISENSLAAPSPEEKRALLSWSE